MGTAIRSLLLGIGGIRVLMFMLGVDLVCENGGMAGKVADWLLSRLRVCGALGGRWL